MKSKTKLVAISAIACSLLVGNPARADGFNPNYIIGNEEVLDYTSMTLDDVRNFLRSKGGYLATYSTTDPDGKLMTAAEIIYDRAVANKVNPKFILVLLQKEMSLIDDKSPKQSQLDWATGYGCFDGAACNPRWKGLWKQINSASLQFRDYMDNPHLYSFRAGGTYNFTNSYSTLAKGDTTVTPMNQATAALYNYTPHVYNGNYNFYRIWQRWFSTGYPDGSLLQAEGDPTVWLIQNGKRRPFSSKGVLMSRYDLNKVISVSKETLERYDKGATIKFAQYSLVKSPKGTVFLIVDNKRHGIASREAFRKVGFNPEEIVDGSWDDLNAYVDGSIITATSSYPTGALLQNNKTGGVFWVMEGVKSPVTDRIFLTTKFRNRKIKAVAPKELDKYATGKPVAFEDGELLKSPDSQGVFLISGGRKRAFPSGEIFEGLGYKWKNIISVPGKILDSYPLGESMALLKVEPEAPDNVESPLDLEALSTTTPSSTIELLATSTLIVPPDPLANVPTGTIINATSTK